MTRKRNHELSPITGDELWWYVSCRCGTHMRDYTIDGLHRVIERHRALKAEPSTTPAELSATVKPEPHADPR